MPQKIDLRKARETTENLIRRAKRRKKEVVRVLYPDRFPSGKGFVAVVVPVSVRGFVLKGVLAPLLRKSEDAIPHGTDQGMAVVFIVPYPEAANASTLAEKAREHAVQIRDGLDVQVIVTRERSRRIRILRRLDASPN